MTASPWSQLYSGRAVDLLDPQPEQIVVDDLIHSLAGLPRYLRHTTSKRWGYSVAQHSVLVADILWAQGTAPEVQLEGLWHDAGEAIYGDMPSPVKRALAELGGGRAWDELTRRVDRVVRQVLGLRPTTRRSATSAST